MPVIIVAKINVHRFLNKKSMLPLGNEIIFLLKKTISRKVLKNKNALSQLLDLYFALIERGGRL